MSEYPSELSKDDVAYLRARSVSPEVAHERRYRTAHKKVDVKRFGFSEPQCLVPGLVVPSYDVVGTNGEASGYQYRPQNPRNVNGRLTKFETPRGARLALDVPPRVRPLLGKPDVPLWFCEGPVKADAAVSHGLACIAMFGVYGWRAKNDFGGTTSVLPQLDLAVHLKGRQVYLAFDSDVMLKPQVHDALSRLYGVLKHRGADVAVVLLPPGENAEKAGLDDYFARGGTVDELVARHVTAELPKLPTLEKEKEKEPEPIVDDLATLAGLLYETRQFFRRFLVFDSAIKLMRSPYGLRTHGSSKRSTCHPGCS